MSDTNGGSSVRRLLDSPGGRGGLARTMSAPFSSHCTLAENGRLGLGQQWDFVTHSYNWKSKVTHGEKISVC